MGLTMGGGPLAGGSRRETNYDITGPERLLFLGDFPRRVRATFGERTVFDTRRGRLLHESTLLPVLYVPDEDIDASALVGSEHTTHCPYKGDASYWDLRAGDSTADNAAWTYPDPKPEAEWLRGHTAFVWEALDAWYDEEERVLGHLRDPFHRLDVRRASGHVRVRHGDRVLAKSSQAKVLSETGLPNMYYLPRADVEVPLEPSRTTTVCPYKGTASYWSTGEQRDAAWSYEDPLNDAVPVAGHVCFKPGDFDVEVAPD
jgi:uncharacterized protein (DUF427 family)